MAESLEILKLPLSRLAEHIGTEMANNPFLELCSMQQCIESMDEIIDVTVQRSEGSRYKVLMLDELPVLSIDERFVEHCEHLTMKPIAREYLEKKIKEARRLMEAIRERKQIVEKVAQAIFDRQPGFLEKGPEHIKPVSVHEIADRIGLSGSTVTSAV